MTGAICATIIVVLGAIFYLVRAYDNITLVQNRNQPFSFPRILEEKEIQLSQLPAVAAAMTRSSEEVVFATLAFGTPGRPSPEDAVNIQISIEDGKLGLDWVLLGPRNIEDRERFLTFARDHGYDVQEHKSNGVSYYRVENVDAVEALANVAKGMYRLDPEEPVGLYYEGFNWSGV